MEGGVYIRARSAPVWCYARDVYVDCELLGRKRGVMRAQRRLCGKLPGRHAGDDGAFGEKPAAALQRLVSLHSPDVDVDDHDSDDDDVDVDDDDDDDVDDDDDRSQT